MIYDHVVNYNGVYYSAGENVPDEVPGDNVGNHSLQDSFVEDIEKQDTPKRGRPKKNQ